MVPEITAGPRGVWNTVSMAMVWHTNHSLKADMFKLQWEWGSTMCKGKTHMQRVRTLL